MLTLYVFPRYYKPIGWMVFAFGIFLAVYFMVYNENNLSILNRKVFALFGDPIQGKEGHTTGWIENNILDELATFFLIVGGLLVGFSRTKIEDEMVAQMRLHSLHVAVFISYGCFLFTTLLVYGFPYLWVLFINSFVLLFIFIVRFHWLLWKHSKKTNEK